MRGSKNARGEEVVFRDQRQIRINMDYDIIY
jgi:hypothetical protein